MSIHIDNLDSHSVSYLDSDSASDSFSDIDQEEKENIEDNVIDGDDEDYHDNSEKIFLGIIIYQRNCDEMV